MLMNTIIGAPNEPLPCNVDQLTVLFYINIQWNKVLVIELFILMI